MTKDVNQKKRIEDLLKILKKRPQSPEMEARIAAKEAELEAMKND